MNLSSQFITAFLCFSHAGAFTSLPKSSSPLISRSIIDTLPFPSHQVHEPNILFSKSDTFEFEDDKKDESQLSSDIRFGNKLKKWRRISTISLAFLTSTFAPLSPHKSILPKPQAASAVGPNLLAPEMPQQQKTGQALEDEIRNDAMRDRMMKDRNAYEAEASRIYREEGSDAHQAFMKKHREEKTAKFMKRREEREKLIERLLLKENIDPFTNMKGRAVLFHFDTGVDLYQTEGTVQYNFEKLKRTDPEKFGKMEQIRIESTRDKIAKLRAEGVSDTDILETFKSDSEVVMTDRQKSQANFEKMKEQRAEIQEKRRQEKELKKIQKLENKNPAVYEEEMAKYNKKYAVESKSEAEDSKEQGESVVVAPPVDPSEIAKAEKEKAKEEKNAAKAKLKAEKLKAKEEAKALKQKAKEEKERIKAAAAAAAAAAATAASAAAGAAASTATSTGAAVGDAIEGAKTIVERNIEAPVADSTEGETQSSSEAPIVSSTPTSVTKSQSKKSPPIVPAVSVIAAIGGGGYGFKYVKDKSAADEEERKRQFDLIMGVDNDNSASPQSFPEIDDDPVDAPLPPSPAPDTSYSSTVSAAATTNVPRKKKGIGSIFSKKSDSDRETDLSNLLSSDALAPNFALTLAKVLTFGAPGRFPTIINLADPPAYPLPSTFDLEAAKEAITNSREEASLAEVMAAELFATVVNCMIIDIVDLASSALNMKGDEKEKDKNTVDALNVVLDFMDHAASLFDAVAEGVTITPVTYGGSLSKSKLEKLFGVYAGSLMSSLMSEDSSTSQDRVDILQQVFSIKDKKAEGIAQKVMMKGLMSAMKDGEGGGMEGLAEMMGGLGGMEGMEGMGDMPGFGDPNAELSPEEIKQSVTMMKQLVESGQISKEEVALVKQQFTEAYGANIEDLIAAADSGDMEGELGEDGKELLELFKTVLDEDN